MAETVNRRPAASSDTPSNGVSPTSREVSERLAGLLRERPDVVSTTVAGTTAGGLAVEAAEITDRGVPNDDKQHVLVVAGQHGNEETARLVALRLIDFLLADENHETLRRQRIVVMPNVSPDAAEADTYATPAGIKPNLDFGPDGQRSPEAAALRKIADALQPDVYVDIHARGHSGWSHDMVLFPPTRPYTEDEHLLHTIASQMAASGEASGIPHVVHPLTWPGWGGYDLNQPSSTLYMYRQFKSLVFLTENAESHDDPVNGSYALETRVASGVCRLKPLLALGNARSPQSFYSGYPLPPVVGMHHAGVVGIGKTAAERRKSRIALWQQSDAFEAVTAVVPEKPGVKRLRVKYSGPTLATGAGFQVRAAGHRALGSVTIDGRPLSAGEADGFVSWHDAHTTFAVAALPSLAPGEHEIVFQFR